MAPAKSVLSPPSRSVGSGCSQLTEYVPTNCRALRRPHFKLQVILDAQFGFRAWPHRETRGPDSQRRRDPRVVQRPRRYQATNGSYARKPVNLADEPSREQFRIHEDSGLSQSGLAPFEASASEAIRQCVVPPPEADFGSPTSIIG